MATCCSRTDKILANLYGPEFILRRHLGKGGAASVCATTGLLKPLLLPIISAIGLVLMPILAALKMEEGDVEGTKGYLQAWGVSFLVLTASIAYVGAVGFSLPLIWSASLLATMCALSIICHVAKAIQEPT